MITLQRTPIPQVKRLLSAIKNNTHLEKIALANMGLYDNDCEAGLKFMHSLNVKFYFQNLNSV